MYKRILVPLDGSRLAECALAHVKNFIKNGSGGEVTLLNVVKVDIVLAAVYDKECDINRMREKLFTASRKYLAEVESRLSSEGIKVKAVSIEANSSADAITDYARENGFDMIVIATHGYTGIKKMLLGSVAMGILHHSPVPVHLIRPEACRVE
jgi:nucleotide-binding universal stress UspA family protein